MQSPDRVHRELVASKGSACSWQPNHSWRISDKHSRTTVRQPIILEPSSIFESTPAKFFRRSLKSSHQPHVRTNAFQSTPVVQELLEMNQIKWPTGFNKEDFIGNGNYGAVCLDSSSSTVVKFPHKGCEEVIRIEIKIYEGGR